jgi:hypothetical protein
MQNPPTVSTPLRKLLERVDNGQLILPEIQRDFVWQKRSVMLLFDSLFRGLPIGHMLVWKAKRAVAARAFHGRKLRTGLILENFYGYLLDGQQRLTALSRVRNGDEEYPLMFCTWPKREEEGDETFVWQAKWNCTDPWYVSVADVLQKRFDVLGYLKNIQANEYYEPIFERRMHDDLFRLTQILDYAVGVIEYETEDYREATQVFIRFNSTGKRLSKGDLFLAELAVHVPSLATKDLQRVAQKHPNFEFTMPFLTQCLLAVCTGRLKTKAKEAWKDENGNDYTQAQIKEAWRKTERGVEHVIRFLTSTVRWQSADLIPSFNALIPLIVIAAENNGINPRNAELARRWLLLAGVRAHFSGSVHSEIDRILRRLKERMSIRELWNATARSLRKIAPSDFQASRISGPVTSMYLSMLAERDARDWLDRHFRLDGKVHGHNAQLQIHHFFPKSLLKKHGRGEDQINIFGNYAVISKSSNLDVLTEEPATYMKRIPVSNSELEKQCIPLDRHLRHVERYEEFLKERARLLTASANAFLGQN